MNLSILFVGATFTLLANPGRADILYVANIGSPPDILKFSSDSNRTVFANIASGLNTPHSFAFDSAGNLFVGSASTFTIQKITPAGVISSFATTGGGFPLALAFDTAGNLYAAMSNLDRIERYTPGGVASVFASGVESPRILAFDSAGSLYTNDGADLIRRFSPSGVGSDFVSGSEVNNPTGLAFDLAGNLYVSNDAANSIAKFSPGGVGSVFATAGLTHPYSIAFDSAGRLYVANTGDNTIRKFSPTGDDLGSFVSTGLHFPSTLAFTDDAGVPLPLANQVPEPGAISLLGLGALGIAARRRRDARS